MQEDGPALVEAGWGTWDLPNWFSLCPHPHTLPPTLASLAPLWTTGVPFGTPTRHSPFPVTGYIAGSQSFLVIKTVSANGLNALVRAFMLTFWMILESILKAPQTNSGSCPGKLMNASQEGLHSALTPGEWTREWERLETPV